jgi:hypothetical protein
MRRVCKGIWRCVLALAEGLLTFALVSWALNRGRWSGPQI